ncbi:MAG: efflux RND transporter periplasmic adaptor subunit [Butyrivibrio sp.]|uniref:efflux RND transporter periplasmic adaptor subunit n=1 Tax=Butyrivibrio sp. TaxID=28121 RepID=UPI0025CFD84D|nr:efflux RND transporter periplasmic adaptor subunit [Butyrivibrio sp.]MCR5772865.1 efflux RND transporter periplasmic adaptor subunit [Butyrivibrio sp.]
MNKKDIKSSKVSGKFKKEKHTFFSKKKVVITGSVIAAGLIGAIVAVRVKNSENSAEQAVYKEETVTYGTLTVGVTESGSITVGTSTQTLDIDISEYTGSTDSFSLGGNTGMMGNSNSQTTSSDSDDDTRVLEVEEIYVSVGQEIAEGDQIAKLTSESVTSIRAELEEDVVSAQNTYDQALAEQESTDLSADSTYSINEMYGSYAQSEYDTTVQTLQDAVDDAQESLDEANETLLEYQEDLEEDQATLKELEALVTNAEYTVNNIDVETAPYAWTDAENIREDAQELYDSCEEEIETLTESISDQETLIQELTIALGQAQEAYEVGVIEAQATYDIHTLYYDNADEIKDVTKAQTALAVEMAADDLEEAKDKLDEFDEYIVDDVIVSGYSGVISEIDIAAGDELYSDSNILVVNDYDQVTITVDVDEDDIDSAQLGAEANVYIETFPDEIYKATVTDVGDATYDSSTATTSYEITVTLEGDDLSELYTGMTSDVTFITTDTADVLYISNRAITRENGVSTVKVKDANGNISTVEVETGFSDGSSVEIKSGLSEGDTVIIESTVN